jgi:hypothetical protein
VELLDCSGADPAVLARLEAWARINAADIRAVDAVHFPQPMFDAGGNPLPDGA